MNPWEALRQIANAGVQAAGQVRVNPNVQIRGGGQQQPQPQPAPSTCCYQGGGWRR